MNNAGRSENYAHSTVVIASDLVQGVGFANFTVRTISVLREHSQPLVLGPRKGVLTVVLCQLCFWSVFSPCNSVSFCFILKQSDCENTLFKLLYIPVKWDFPHCIVTCFYVQRFSLP